MRLNLGCGQKNLAGWLNVDKYPAAAVDQIADLEALPWPWPDDSVDEVLLSHVLEHLGAQTEVYLGIIKELYRVCRDGATIKISVPHPRHDDFLGDPTHVRPITPEHMMLFSQAANRISIANNRANTPLGIYLGVDFEIKSLTMTFEPAWMGRLERKEISLAELEHAMRSYNNVVKQVDLIMHPVKPAGRTSAGSDTAQRSQTAAKEPAAV